ncbi:MAG: PEP-CTERM sorting domain-containing protein [Pirellulaceae bacterium]
MKKLLATMTAVVLSLGLTMSAQAELVTITFDESFVNPGTVNNRYDGTQVSTHYSDSSRGGVTWDDIYPSTVNSSYTGQVVCMPGEFSGPDWNTGNYLFIYGDNAGSGTSAQTAYVTLSTPSDYFSIEYRRPQASGTFDFDLYLGSTRVYDGPSLTWNPGDGWTKFTATSNMFQTFHTFDKVVILENDKSSFDNLTIEPVPEPSSLVLFVGGAVALLVIRRVRCRS